MTTSGNWDPTTNVIFIDYSDIVDTENNTTTYAESLNNTLDSDPYTVDSYIPVISHSNIEPKNSYFVGQNRAGSNSYAQPKSTSSTNSRKANKSSSYYHVDSEVGILEIAGKKTIIDAMKSPGTPWRYKRMSQLLKKDYMDEFLRLAFWCAHAEDGDYEIPIKNMQEIVDIDVTMTVLLCEIRSGKDTLASFKNKIRTDIYKSDVNRSELRSACLKTLRRLYLASDDEYIKWFLDKMDNDSKKSSLYSNVLSSFIYSAGNEDANGDIKPRNRLIVEHNGELSCMIAWNSFVQPKSSSATSSRKVYKSNGYSYVNSKVDVLGTAEEKIKVDVIEYPETSCRCKSQTMPKNDYMDYFLRLAFWCYSNEECYYCFPIKKMKEVVYNDVMKTMTLCERYWSESRLASIKKKLRTGICRPSVDEDELRYACLNTLRILYLVCGDDDIQWFVEKMKTGSKKSSPSIKAPSLFIYGAGDNDVNDAHEYSSVLKDLESRNRKSSNRNVYVKLWPIAISGFVLSLLIYLMRNK